MRIKVVSWNMHAKAENWRVLDEDARLKDADVFLLCEAPPWDEVRPNGLCVVGHGSTKGIGCRCEGDGCEKRTYSTAIASRHPLEPMPKRTRVDTYYRQHLPFEPSRAGTWTAARVNLDPFELTAIALYGLNDEAYSASIHRSLSELSPVFDRRALSRYLVLGGDFNLLPRPARRTGLNRGQVVMERIRAYGLEDCYQLKSSGPGPEAKNCTCGQPETCSHARTFFRPDKPDVPYQDDYLFASSALTRHRDRMTSEVLPVSEFYPGSDHAPIVAQFEVEGKGQSG